MERKVAVGGMAEIFFGRTKSGTPVAIKKIHPNLSFQQKFVQMFLDEARVAVSLQHPNIVQTLDFGRIDSTYFFSLEWIDGKSLSEVIVRQAQTGIAVPTDVAMLMMVDISRALHYAHNKRDRFNRPLGIVHRDISPPNIMVTRKGIAKLADFGIAFARGKSVQTQPGIIRGKFSYMSPEQATGHIIDHRSDLFSLGVVFYEFLTASRLFLREKEQDTLEAVRKCQIPPLRVKRPDVSERLQAIVLRMLAPTSRERFQSALELKRELKNLLKIENPNIKRECAVDFLQRLFPEEKFHYTDLSSAELSVITTTGISGSFSWQVKAKEWLLAHPWIASLSLGFLCIILVEVFMR